jgi:acyl transferase domain-containing protein/NADPH:quinone reductase-like Zn-dependent oxidoreductase/acyl carrier protein
MKRKRVAILGASFRLPSSTRESFWSDLIKGKNLVSCVAPERWAQDAYWHPRRSHLGTSYTFAAGSIGDVAAFDAEFFGISPREAAQMDPQQRLLLELTWEAVEHAGIPASGLRGSACGVYVGVSTIDYSFRFADDLAAVDSAVATGTSSSITANRISYVFDLRGPSMAVDTACSSSLVAFHLACRSIATGECGQAIVGGVSLHTHPYGFVAFSKASMLSRQGACRVFDAAGDGYVRSEGGGVFLLKDHDQALADGDRILAVVAGSAVNSDGRKSGLTVPSVQAQAALLSRAYAEAGIAPSEIDYLEAHGTGTAVGDPVETHALGEALGRHRARGSPLLIGSVKSNLGHLEAAAGMAGLVKALYCVQHRQVPATIHLSEPNPNIRLDEWNLKVATETTPLKRAGKVVVGVNSFGFGGANAHVILESPPARRTETGQSAPVTPLPVVVSGKSAAALKAAARNLAQYVRAHEEIPLYDVAYSAALHREWHEHRAIVLAGTTSSVAAALEDFAANPAAAVAVQTGTALPAPAGLAFIYAGNGSQWAGMGRGLLAAEPLFRDAVRAVDAVFRRHAGYSIEEKLAGEPGPAGYEFTEIAQPALFALQVGVTELLRARGIVPAAVAGHSVGEVAAAWACGALSLEQAVQVIYHRSRLQGTTKGTGQMTAVGLGEAAVREMLNSAGLAHALAIAGINSLHNVTVAGAAAALEALEAVLSERKVLCKRLDLDYAFHSPAMDRIEAPIVDALADLRPGAARIPFYSSVTGEEATGVALGADYWWRNIREPVRFEQAVKSMLAQGARVFVEVGPHALLRGYIAACLADAKLQGRIVPTVLRGDDDPRRVWSAVCQAAVAGARVEWKALFPERGRYVELPAYPWQRERYWHEVSTESGRRLNRHREHPLLGHRLHEHEWTWENHIDTLLCPELADHVIGDAAVMPGTGYAEMALAAGRLWQGGDHTEIEQLEIRAPLLLTDAPSKIVRFAIDVSDGSFTIRSRDQGGADWTVHATGRISQESAGAVPPPPLALPARTPDFSGADHNRLTQAVGLDYGPAFQALDAIWVEDGSTCARFRIPAVIEADLERLHLHPALLDCTFQLIIQLLKDEYVAQAGTVYVPAKIERLHLRAGRGRPHMARATLRSFSPHSVTASFSLHDAGGAVVAWIPEARFNSMPLRKNPADRLRYLDYHGVPKPHHLSPATAPRLLFEQLHKLLGGVVHARRGQRGLARYSTEIEPLLDGLCGRFAARALRALAADGCRVTQADLRACADASADAAPLLTRLIGMLQEDNAITPEGDGWYLLPDGGLPAPEAIWNSLVMEYPDYLPLLHGVGRVGVHLADLLQGRLTLQQVLPRDCTLSRLTRPVMADAGAHAMAQAIQELVAQMLRRLPPGQRLRIAEAGAGQPWFAATVCQSVDFTRCDYAFATTAAATSEECLGLREGFPRVAVRQIDPASLEAAPPPASEQFQLALVVADFETEAAALLALNWVRHHLAPCGAIVVVEQHPSRWMDFVFGARRSWWSEAADGLCVSRHRPAHLLRHQMQRLGFQSCTALELCADTASGPYVLLAHEPDRGAAAVQFPPAAAHTWLLLADKDGFSGRLADQMARTLEARGDRVIHATPGSQFAALAPGHYQLNPCEPGQMEALLAQLGAAFGGLDGILHLLGLGASSGSGAPLLLLEQQVDRCAAAAAIHKACELSRISTTCWLVTARASTAWLHGGEQPSREKHAADGVDATLWGFGRTMMNEASMLEIRLLDIDDAAALDTTTYAMVREITQPDAEQEIALTASGCRYAPRLRIEASPARQPDPAALFEAPTLRLGLRSPGQLRNLRWESHARVHPGRDELEIEIHATGLNFRDVMYALGLLSEEAVEGGFAGPALGLEFAGVVMAAGEEAGGFTPGDRVVGFGPHSFADRVITKSRSVARIPPGMAFEAAATIPSAFLTVYYALNHLTYLGDGERILIHGAAGGVGLAAIQLARRRGAEIFATAGSEEKRDFLRLLGADHVFDSRSLAFADEILAITEGEGVDVVLNSLAGEAINRNLRVLRPFGRFLELGKRDFQENTRIGLRPFRNNISYFGIDADQLMMERPELTARLFREMIALFAEGALHPLPYQCFEAEDIVDAFRYMQQSRHIGKIVVTYRNGIRSQHVAEQSRRKLELPADATYLVTGGLSGFGLRTAQWLAAKGARNLVLVSRSGSTTPEARAGVAALEAAGVRVHAAACDVTDRRALAALLSEIAVILPPLRGIVHAAAVIEDGLIRNVNRSQIRRVLAPKILGAHHLHQLTLGRELDFFIMFSSATTLFGNPGQASYVAANAGVEALAAARQAAGLPALCVRWGAIDDTGYLARNPEVKEALQGRMGGSALQSAVALDALEELVLAHRSGLAVLELDWKALGRFLPTAGTPKFGELALNADDAKADEGDGQDIRRLLATLPEAEFTAAFIDLVKKEVGEILRIAPDRIDENRPLYDIGFDSLMGVELATAVEARFGVRLPVMALSDGPTVAKLCARIIAQLTDSEGSEEEPAASDVAEQARQIATQHADEAHVDAIARTVEELQSGEFTAVSRMIQ